ARHTRAERRDERLDLVAVDHLVEARALDVQDLAAERENRLKTAVSALLRGATGGVTLDQVDLAFGRVLALTIRELSGQRGRVEHTLARDHLARLPSRFAGPRGEHT